MGGDTDSGGGTDSGCSTDSGGGTDRSDDVETVYLALTTIIRRSQQLSSDLHPGLSLAAYTVLTQVAAEPGTRARDLADHFGLDKSTLSRQLDQLEGGGLLRRGGELPGRRGSVLEVTPTGTRMLEEAAEAIRRTLAARLARWEDRDVATFAHLLEAFNRAPDRILP